MSCIIVYHQLSAFCKYHSTGSCLVSAISPKDLILWKLNLTPDIQKRAFFNGRTKVTVRWPKDYGDVVDGTRQPNLICQNRCVHFKRNNFQNCKQKNSFKSAWGQMLK